MTAITNPKNFLIIQHEDATTPGSTISWLQKNGFSYTITRVDQGETLPKDLFDLGGVIICGGTQNTDQESEFPWLKKEKDFIKLCVSKNIPTLGLCLGAQLLAEVLNAKVFKADKWEYGWQDIFFSKEVSAKWASVFNTHRKVFQAHGYRFNLPQGFHPLATSPSCEFQGFYSDDILAFQFHPEVDLNWIQLSLQGFVPNGEYCQNPLEISASNSIYLDSNQLWYFEILNKFFIRT